MISGPTQSSQEAMFPVRPVHAARGYLASAAQSQHIGPATEAQLDARLAAIVVRCQHVYTARWPWARGEASADPLSAAEAQAVREEQRIRHSSQPRGNRPMVTVAAELLVPSGCVWATARPAKREICRDTFAAAHDCPTLRLEVVALAQAATASPPGVTARRDAWFAETVAKELGVQIEACIAALWVPRSTRQVEQAIAAAFEFGWYGRLELAQTTHEAARRQASALNACHGLAAVAFRDHLYISHCGRSRAYLVRGIEVTQVTVDHRVDEPSEPRPQGLWAMQRASWLQQREEGSSRLICDMPAAGAWPPQITRLARSDCHGGHLLLVAASLAGQIERADVQRAATRAAAQGVGIAAIATSLVHLGASRSDGCELGIATMALQRRPLEATS